MLKITIFTLSLMLLPHCGGIVDNSDKVENSVSQPNPDASSDLPVLYLLTIVLDDISYQTLIGATGWEVDEANTSSSLVQFKSGDSFAKFSHVDTLCETDTTSTNDYSFEVYECSSTLVHISVNDKNVAIEHNLSAESIRDVTRNFQPKPDE